MGSQPRLVSPTALSKPGYAVPVTRSRPLLLVGIQGVQCGGRIRTQGLCHSVDVLVQYGAHPYLHPVSMLSPFTPRLIGDREYTVIWDLSSMIKQTVVGYPLFVWDLSSMIKQTVVGYPLFVWDISSMIKQTVVGYPLFFGTSVP